jgi:hypothetical protein
MLGRGQRRPGVAALTVNEARPGCAEPRHSGGVDSPLVSEERHFDKDAIDGLKKMMRVLQEG